MSTRWTVAAAGCVAALAVTLGLVLVPADPAHAAPPQTPNDRLQVWNLNTHEMAPGTNGTDYREFVYYITDSTRVAYLPDIVTLQEAGTKFPDGTQHPSCHVFEAALETRTGVDYYCYETKQYGGAAIVYRTGRLSLVAGSNKFVQLKQRLTVGGSCVLDDWRAMVMRLSDDNTQGKYVNVASVHLPYNPDVADADCSWDNMKLLNTHFGTMGSASMQVMAGDWNAVDGVISSGAVNWECWYEGTAVGVGKCGTTVPNLGWKDVMYRLCNTTGTAAYNCLDANHWTMNSLRIDFLFAKAYAVYNQVTVDFAAAYQSSGALGSGRATKYSDHRGQGSLLKYYD